MEVVVGRVGRAHGVRGEVSVEVRTDEPERRFAPGATLRAEDRTDKTLTVHAVRPHGARLLVSFEQITDRTGAESLRGATLFAQVAESDRPEHPDEFYDHQLVGLTVRTDQRGAVGQVSAVMHLPEQDVLVVSTGEGTESLVPFVAALVPSVDLDAGELTVADQPGLLDGGDG
jgi:16S rRNA processing protein RimM